MATTKKGKNKQVLYSTKPSAAIKESLFSDFKKGEAVKFFIGLLLIVAAIFMTIAFVSYITNGNEDQSVVEQLQNPAFGVDNTVTTAPHVHNATGIFGAKIGYFFLDRMFGLPSFFFPLFLFVLGLKFMDIISNANLWRKFVNYAFLMIWFSVALSTFIPSSIREKFFFHPGGQHGEVICEYAKSMIGAPGLIFALLVLAIGYLIYASSRTIKIIRKILDGNYFTAWKTFFSSFKNKLFPPKLVVAPVGPVLPPETGTIEFYPPKEKDEGQNNNPDSPDNKSDNPDEGNIEVDKGKEEEKGNKETAIDDMQEYDPKLDLEFYKYPPLDLLKTYDNQKPLLNMDELHEYQRRITTVLHNFGVEINTIRATVGPTITLYEITPAQGVRISKIRGLEDDIALSLAAMGVRIIAPIPGKGTIGIEVPNKNAQIVSGESVLNTIKFQECTYELPIALGKTINNEVYIKDLAELPHLLVAGATGQGKSVGLNAIITSLLYKKHPSELKLVLIDPKKVEFSIYAPLAKHFLAALPGETNPIVTDVKKVVSTLKSLCQEMDNRYVLLEKAKCRHIKDYNRKFKARELNPEEGHRYLPYFVIIIDEFGDLIMTAGKEIELPIARIAQLARAVGMHMVIATQRPTTNIITGTIKANFPARMAFKVASQIDSRTILDQSGADKLIGRGDMLIQAKSITPERVQCAFIDTPEVVKINNFISHQQGYLEPYQLPEVSTENDDKSGNGADSSDNLDSMFEEVARMIVTNQQGSTSWVQRKFSIGYNRAGRLMDQMEHYGIVGAAHGSKPREVLIADENHLQQILDNIL